MRKAPFHRRILPWIFAIVFFLMAPAVIFYTSGYRYDAKKGKVESNGTVILDSTPNSADIQIDGRPINQQTPSTLQDVTPGTHQFSLTKPGFHSWEKNLEVRPALVTFANAISLWRDASSTFDFATTSTKLFASPDNKHLVTLQNAETSVLNIFTVASSGAVSPLATFEVKSLIGANPEPRWSTNDRLLLLQASGNEPTSDSWALDTTSKQVPTKLPPAMYRWSGRLLDGSDRQKLIEFDTANNSLTRTPFSSGIFDRFDGYDIRTTTGTSQLVLVTPDKPNEGLILPYGNWSIWDVQKTFILLRDGNQWLSLVIAGDHVSSHMASGSRAFEVSDGKTILVLLVDGTQIESWDPTAEPTLLYRQSEPVVQAVWYPTGHDLLFATHTTVSVLNLDERDGRIITPLAHFDTVSDIATTDKNLYVLGSVQEKIGLWTVPLQ